MDRQGLQKLRTEIGATQAEMASTMGMPLRTYEDIEAGRSAFRPIHERAVYYAAMAIATVNKTIDKLPKNIFDRIEAMKGRGECEVQVYTKNDDGTFDLHDQAVFSNLDEALPAVKLLTRLGYKVRVIGPTDQSARYLDALKAVGIVEPT